MTHEFEAVIFDLDGTLVDTERLAIQTGLAAFAAMGYPDELAFLTGLIGSDSHATARAVAARFPALDYPTFDATWKRAFRDSVAADLQLKPGVKALLAQIRQPCAVCTSSSREGALRKLALTGLDDSFAHVIARDDVQAPKPASEPYLLAAARLGVAPARCLVFEDSDIGAQAARAAGMVVVQVPDMQATDGPFADHLAADLLSGARAMGLIPA